MKYNKNLAGIQITDELINRASSAAARLAHDTILRSTVIVRTAPGGGGTLLALTTDYTLGSEDSRLTTEAGGTVNTTLAVVNGAYQNTNLYVSYKTVGDYAEAEDVTTLVVSFNIASSNQSYTLPSANTSSNRRIRIEWSGGDGTYALTITGTAKYGGANVTTWNGQGTGYLTIFSNGTSWHAESYSDYGSNSNGSFIKNIDGSIKEYGTFSAATDISTAYFGGFRSGGFNATLAIPMISNPLYANSYDTSLSSFASLARPYSASTLSCLWLAVTSQTSATRKLAYEAFGFWR